MKFFLNLSLLLLFFFIQQPTTEAVPPLRDVLGAPQNISTQLEQKQERRLKRLRKKLAKRKNPLLIGLGVIGLLLLIKRKTGQKATPPNQRVRKKKGGKIFLYILLGIIAYYILAFLLLINGVAVLPFVFF